MYIARTILAFALARKTILDLFVSSVICQLHAPVEVLVIKMQSAFANQDTMEAYVMNSIDI